MSLIDSIVCINLKTRKDRKNFMKKQARKKGKFKFQFFTTTKHADPVRGCLESHQTILKDALQKGVKNILILEDDAKFLQELKTIPPPPADYTLAYLSGTILGYHESESDSDSDSMEPESLGDLIGRKLIRGKKKKKKKQHWKRLGSCWSTHAYVVNGTFIEPLLKILKNWESEIDRCYVECVQAEHPCYVLNPTATVQQNGYSDIQNTYVDYTNAHKMALTKPYDYASHSVDQGRYRLILMDVPFDQLPRVSLITPTRNRARFIPMAVSIFRNFVYPWFKLEWVIIDDSDEPIEKLLPENKNIIYRHIKTKVPLAVSVKRNMAVRASTGDIILHMDDDDYYCPHSVMARVKTLLSNPGKGCVGCTQLGC